MRRGHRPVSPIAPGPRAIMPLMPVDRRQLGAIAVGGFCGALVRAEVVTAIGSKPGAWPWATLLVNVAGAAFLGYVVAGLPRWRPLLGIGFCGALTTFSTMQLELLAMLDRDRIALAVGYAAVSITVGLVAVSLGIRLTHHPDPEDPIA